MGANFFSPKSSHQLEKTACIRAYPQFSTSFLGDTRHLICTRKYVIWRFISTPTPLFHEHHETFYENFLPRLVSTTCKLTPFQTQLGSVLNRLYQKQPSRGVLRKMCSENMHAANFIYRRTPMPKCNLLNSHFDLRVLEICSLFLRTPLGGCFCCIPSLSNKSFTFCESKLNLIRNLWLFAKYVLFIFCLLHFKFKPSLATLFSLMSFSLIENI